MMQRNGDKEEQKRAKRGRNLKEGGGSGRR